MQELTVDDFIALHSDLGTTDTLLVSHDTKIRMDRFLASLQDHEIQPLFEVIMKIRATNQQAKIPFDQEKPRIEYLRDALRGWEKNT